MRIPGRGVLPALAILFLSAAPVLSQECSGFPWTVTAAPAGGRTVSVSICGSFAGCRPHNPQFAVNGSQIVVSLTQAEPPDCLCIAVDGTFRENVLVSPVDPGIYAVNVVQINCAVRTDAGSTTVTFAPSAAIPLLNRRALAAVAVLIALISVRLLRS